MDAEYIKYRRDFGRQPLFTETHTQLLDTIAPDTKIQKQFILRNPVHQPTQVYHKMNEHTINTITVVMKDSGANHAEGGWPKEINYLDEEATSRHRRRIERDDDYVNAILNKYSSFEHYLKQNNAIEMYQMYFNKMAPEEPVEKIAIQLNNIYKDDGVRPVSSISWTVDDDPKIVVSYCSRNYPITGPVNTKFHCYLWAVDNPIEPLMTLYGSSAVWKLTCSPTNSSWIIGGLDSGKVCIYDIRESQAPIRESPEHLAHRYPVNSVLFVASRSGTEFFSSSTDGVCKFWDLRDLSQPFEETIMSVVVPPGDEVSIGNSESVSVLEYERSIPTRFLCGTDSGKVINVNRKGRSHQEMMTGVYPAHLGPVKAVHRCPSILKMFITCGDWRTHLWSDDTYTSPIITGIPQRYKVTDANWAPHRSQCYMTANSNGSLYYWDLLRKWYEPVLTMPLAHCPLLKVEPHEDGKFVAVGDQKGSTYLVSLSQSLILPGPKDKQLFSQIYERETRREHILENRIKEIRLKQKTEEEGGGAAAEVVEVVDEDALCRAAEEEYRKIVQADLKEYGSVGPAKPPRTDEKKR